jgi:hypothetical protein
MFIRGIVKSKLATTAVIMAAILLSKQLRRGGGAINKQGVGQEAHTCECRSSRLLFHWS